MILKAPRGVTRTAGANAYATKLATSPTITENQNEMKFVRSDVPFTKKYSKGKTLTGDHSYPP